MVKINGEESCWNQPPNFSLLTNIASELRMFYNQLKYWDCVIPLLRMAFSEVLIHWEHGSSIDAIWELVSMINDQFHEFHLEDEVAL